jgi:CheY-like chemotaxis protein
MMDGTIHIESELGKGASFIFTAKLALGAEKQETLLGPGINWGNLKILAVDDGEDIREYFKTLGEQLGFSCDIASDGEEAIALIEKKGAYDIYFVDWKMPGMNGIELSRWIKEKGGGAQRSVVIMISAAEWNLIEDDAKQAGVDKFLAKPLFPSMVADIITQCLGKDSHLPAAAAGTQEVDNFEGCRILLAEDVEINQEIVMSILEPTSLVIDCADNGVEAVKCFNAAPESYQMIFMDVQMPEMDGYEATRAIRASGAPNAKTIPIIAMTANVFREDIEKCLEAGMDGHVGKPLDFEDVLAILRQYLPRSADIKSIN